MEPTPNSHQPGEAKETPKPFLTWTRVNLIFPAIVVAVCLLLRVCETPGVNNAPIAFFLSGMAQIAALILNVFACRPHAKGLWPLQILLVLGSSLLTYALIFIGCGTVFLLS